MFNSVLLNDWLHERGVEIMSKVGKEEISANEMTILALKAENSESERFHREISREIIKLEGIISENTKAVKEEMLLLRKEAASDRDHFRGELSDFRKESICNTTALREEMRENMALIRSDVKNDIDQLRTDVKEDVNQLKSEIGQVRTEIKGDITHIRNDLRWLTGLIVTIILGALAKEIFKF